MIRKCLIVDKFTFVQNVHPNLKYKFSLPQLQLPCVMWDIVMTSRFADMLRLNTSSVDKVKIKIYWLPLRQDFKCLYNVLQQPYFHKSPQLELLIKGSNSLFVLWNQFFCLFLFLLPPRRLCFTLCEFIGYQLYTKTN